MKKCTEPEEINNFLKEQAVMTEMVHPNVVRLYGLIEQGTVNARFLDQAYN